MMNIYRYTSCRIKGLSIATIILFAVQMIVPYSASANSVSAIVGGDRNNRLDNHFVAINEMNDASDVVEVMTQEEYDLAQETLDAHNATYTMSSVSYDDQGRIQTAWITEGADSKGNVRYDYHYDDNGDTTLVATHQSGTYHLTTFDSNGNVKRIAKYLNDGQRMTQEVIVHRRLGERVVKEWEWLDETRTTATRVFRETMSWDDYENNEVNFYVDSIEETRNYAMIEGEYYLTYEHIEETSEESKFIGSLNEYYDYFNTINGSAQSMYDDNGQTIICCGFSGEAQTFNNYEHVVIDGRVLLAYEFQEEQFNGGSNTSEVLFEAFYHYDLDGNLVHRATSQMENHSDESGANYYEHYANHSDNYNKWGFIGSDPVVDQHADDWYRDLYGDEPPVANPWHREAYLAYYTEYGQRPTNETSLYDYWFGDAQVSDVSDLTILSGHETEFTTHRITTTTDYTAPAWLSRQASLTINDEGDAMGANFHVDSLIGWSRYSHSYDRENGYAVVASPIDGSTNYEVRISEINNGSLHEVYIFDENDNFISKTSQIRHYSNHTGNLEDFSVISTPTRVRVINDSVQVTVDLQFDGDDLALSSIHIEGDGFNEFSSHLQEAFDILLQEMEVLPNFPNAAKLDPNSDFYDFYIRQGHHDFVDITTIYSYDVIDGQKYISEELSEINLGGNIYGSNTTSNNYITTHYDVDINNNDFILTGIKTTHHEVQVDYFDNGSEYSETRSDMFNETLELFRYNEANELVDVASHTLRSSSSEPMPGNMRNDRNGNISSQTIQSSNWSSAPQWGVGREPNLLVVDEFGAIGYEYDGQGRVIEQRMADGRVIQIDYANPNSHLINQNYFTPLREENIFDGDGNLIKTLVYITYENWTDEEGNLEPTVHFIIEPDGTNHDCFHMSGALGSSCIEHSLGLDELQQRLDSLTSSAIDFGEGVRVAAIELPSQDSPYHDQGIQNIIETVSSGADVDTFVVDNTAEAIASRIEQVAHEGYNIINLSLQITSLAAATRIKEAIDIAVDLGVTNIIISAGNNSTSPELSYIADSEAVTVVGSTDFADRRAGHSNIGEHIDIVTYGVDILTWVENLSMRYLFTGTSFATAIVSGMMAGFLSVDRYLNGAITIDNDQANDLLTNSATDAGSTGFDHFFGSGLLNPLQAFDNLLQLLGIR